MALSSCNSEKTKILKNDVDLNKDGHPEIVLCKEWSGTQYFGGEYYDSYTHRIRIMYSNKDGTYNDSQELIGINGKGSVENVKYLNVDGVENSGLVVDFVVNDKIIRYKKLNINHGF